MNRDRALKCLHEELGAWPQPSTLRAEVPEIPGWRWEVRAAKATLERRDAAGFVEVITDVDWAANQYHFDEARHWIEGEERIDRIAQSDASGDHYGKDAGAHYRREYKGIKLDPYRIAKVYGMQGGPREQIMKKCLRFTDKGQTEQQVVDEIRTALNRWQEMLEEGEL